MRYTVTEAEAILSAYRALFPRVNGALAEYWDRGGLREWSCLTTDFHALTPRAIARFDEAVRAIAREPGACEEAGERLRMLARVHGVGFSLGISPWTDDLLLRTFNARTRKVLIILGHDWYPIATTDLSYRATPPLERASIFDEPAYGEAVPKILWADGETAVLFLNLYPDFRAPGANVMGSLGDYAPWLCGFEALCATLAETFEIKAIVSWGSNVWEALNRTLDREWRHLGVMAAVTRQAERGCAHELPLGKGKVAYFAFAHPSFAPNFRRATHLGAYRAALDRLAGVAMVKGPLSEMARGK